MTNNKIIKGISALLLAAALIVVCFSCTSKNGNLIPLKNSKVFVAESAEEIAGALAKAVNMDKYIELTEESLPAYFGFDSSLVSESKVYVNVLHGSTEEIAVFRYEAQENAETLINAVSKRAEQKSKTFVGAQDLNEKKLSDTCLVFSSGSYIVMVVSEKVDSAKKALESFYVESDVKK